MSYDTPARRAAAVPDNPTSKELSLARRERNMAREDARRAAKLAAKGGRVLAGDYEVTGETRHYRGDGAVTKAYWRIRDNWTATAPPVTGAGVFTTGAASYLLASSTDLSPGHVGALGLLAAAAAAFHTRKKLASPERAADRWWVRIGSVSTAGWLALATQIGPMHTAALSMFAVGGSACAWRWYRYHDGAVQAVEAELVEVEAEPEPVIPEPDPEALLLEHWRRQWTEVTDQLPSIKGSEVTAVTLLGVGHLTLTVRIVPVRQDADKVVSAAKNIETGLLTDTGQHLRPGALNIIPDPDDSTLVHVHIRAENPLTEPIGYGEVAGLLPRSAHDPMLMGRREDKAWDYVRLDGRHWLIGADTGGGKSNLIHTIMANLAYMVDVVVWGADKKGGRALGPWLPRIDWLATTLDEIDLQLRSLESILAYRESLDIESDQITVRADLPGIVYIIDEGAEITGSRSPRGAEFARRLERIASLGRALGVWIIYATQYCSLESLTSAIFRQQLTVQFLLPTTSRLAASFVLGEDAWTKIKLNDLSEAGMYFRRVMGQTSTMCARTPYMTPGNSNDLVKRLAREGSRTAPQLDPGSARYTVPEYTTRRSRLNPKLVRAFLSDDPAAVGEGGSSYHQIPLPVGDSAISGGSVPELPGGSSRGETPGGSWEGSDGVPEGGFPADSTGASGGGFPPGSPTPDELSAKARLDEIWARVPAQPNVVPIDAAARRAAANIDVDAIFGEAQVSMARALADCGPDGLTRKDLRAITNMGHDWVSTRANALLRRGVCEAPRGVTGRYKAALGVDEAAILASLAAIAEDLSDARRRARTQMETAN